MGNTMIKCDRSGCGGTMWWQGQRRNEVEDFEQLEGPGGKHLA
ncbi:hypothetical protein TSOC_004831 [Tetrabaena socialis]|uniref:Uncharacterized protein n=1 Tax=Tetrabaena socialis TaxID=47790 RepID=A0A2J8A7T2_9CHLO|nr:hypothetical protein TSOC_004831 [Tetrabaena socialis]|eukprot:PNH08581.1 hypothetical protein TSOC_004831 [Tetrabaena socialis]